MSPGTRRGRPWQAAPSDTTATKQPVAPKGTTTKRATAARRDETRRALTWHAEQSMAKGDVELARLALWLREAV